MGTPVTEKQIETLILTWLNHQPGIIAFKINTTGIYDTKRKCFRTIKNPYIPKGMSDIIGCYQGWFFAIEVKTPREYKKAIQLKTRHDLEQNSFLLSVCTNDGFSFLVSSLEEVQQAIEYIRTSVTHRYTKLV